VGSTSPNRSEIGRLNHVVNLVVAVVILNKGGGDLT
jgi:hypothetical protein